MSQKNNYRIYIRPLDEKDITDRYLSWFSNSDVSRFSGSSPKKLSKEDVLNYNKKGVESKEYFMFAIVEKEQELHIGNVKIGPINYQDQVSDLATIIGDTDYWGKGLATEAIKVASEFAFGDFQFRKLSGHIVSDNIASLKAYGKAGWIVEGILKNHIKINDKFMDKIIISKFNPEIFDCNLIGPGLYVDEQ